MPAHSGHHGDVAGGGRRTRRIVVVVAQDDHHVRRPEDQPERRVRDGDEDVVQVAGGADLLLRVVEVAKSARVALDDRFVRNELVDLADCHDAGVVRIVADRHFDRDHLIARPELDDVARRERALTPVRVVEHRTFGAAHDRCPVPRAIVGQDVPFAHVRDARVIARDVLVVEAKVAVGRASDANDVRRRVDLAPRRGAS